MRPIIDEEVAAKMKKKNKTNLKNKTRWTTNFCRNFLLHFIQYLGAESGSVCVIGFYYFATTFKITRSDLCRTEIIIHRVMRDDDVSSFQVLLTQRKKRKI